MGHLCMETPKPTLSIGGSLKVIDFCLNNCLYSGIKRIAVITGYHGDQIAQHVSGWNKSHDSRCDISILSPENGLYAGTADAAWQNIELLRREKYEKILVLAADHVYKMDYRHFLRFHCDRKSDMTIAVSEVSSEDASRYGIVTINNDDCVLEFHEKPPVPSSNLASMGIYIFNRDVLFECLANDAAKRYSTHDFGYSVIPEMLRNKKVSAYRFGGYWRDIGTIESYYNTNLELIDILPLLNADRRWSALNHAGKLLSYCTSTQGKIIHSLISPGCIIKGRVENSVLSPCVVVNEYAVVKNSIIMQGSSIGRYSRIKDYIVEAD